MLARLKPYDPKRGQLLRGMTVPQLRAARFVEGRWYDLAQLAQHIGKGEGEIVEVLRSIHQDPTNTSTPKAFDIATSEEAQRMADNELREAVRATPPAVAPEVPKVAPPERSTPAGPPATQGPRGGGQRGPQQGGQRRPG